MLLFYLPRFLGESFWIQFFFAAGSSLLSRNGNLCSFLSSLNFAGMCQRKYIEYRSSFLVDSVAIKLCALGVISKVVRRNENIIVFFRTTNSVGFLRVFFLMAGSTSGRRRFVRLWEVRKFCFNFPRYRFLLFTDRGLLDNFEAERYGVGGELICFFSY